MLLKSILTPSRDTGRPLLTFHDERGKVIESRTPSELLKRGERIAGHLLHRLGLAPGDRAALVYLPSLHFVDALVGCLLSGVQAVPLAPPDPGSGDVETLRRVCADSKARVILTETTYDRARLLGRLRRWAGLRAAPAWPDLPWLVTDRLSDSSQRIVPYQASTDEVAFLQYTSGSTGHPKGVRITHGNLRHQLAFNSAALGMDENSQFAMWVPHFHDFGLISGICSALAGNGRLAIQSPLTFLRRPGAWIELLSQTRATHTAAPNFAYELSVRKTTPAERARWNLSSLRVAMSAAEPVRWETLDRFAQAFAVSGFRPEALCPAYGLAEHTVGVTVGGRLRLRISPAALAAHRLVVAEDGLTQVGCGKPTGDVAVRIVDPETQRVLPDGEVGEIWVDSPSKADGYEGQPELSEATFRAQTSPPDGRRYLRTGDFGAFHQDELVITGRLKDLILIRGRNVHAVDVEDAVREAHPAIRPGGVAAFGVPNAEGTEDLVVLAELQGEAKSEDVASAVRVAAGNRLAGVHVSRVVLGRKGIIPKTTSGKIRRRACRELIGAPGFAQRSDVIAVLEQAPAPLPEALPATELAAPPARPAPIVPERSASAVHVPESELARIAGAVLGRALVASEYERPWRELGMSSLQLVQFCARVEEELRVPLTPERLFEAPTVRELAALLAQGQTGTSAPTPPAADEPVAIVGMACRYPGGIDEAESFWEAVKAGHAPRSASLEVRAFDPVPFSIPEREAASMAPEQRLALELAWETLESAGFSPDRTRGLRCGVFLGSSATEYGLATVYGGKPDAWAALGSMPSVIAGRVSYVFGLVGPAMVVDTACSSSLLAVHLAVAALRRGECDYALVGGVNVSLTSEVTESLRALGALSPTGRCWSFDARADGYARGDGAGMVLLKRAADVRPTERVFAQVLSSATNHDGRSNGLTAPNPAQQRALLREAWSKVQGGCGFIEAHGTGTTLGDAIELDALAGTVGAHGPVRVSSAKGNFGHTEAAAGITGLLRASLALFHRAVPPQASFETPSPRFPWSEHSLLVPRSDQPWEGPLTAGISSFGLSGTNVHVVLGPAPAAPATATVESDRHALVIAAHSPESARARARALAEHLRKPGVELQAVAAAHNAIQPAHAWRVGIVAGDAHQAASLLSEGTVVEAPAEPRLAMIFPGQGSLRSGAFTALWNQHPLLRRSLDEAFAQLAELAGTETVDALLHGDDAACQRTDRAQPGLLVAGWALWRLWEHAGLAPAVVAGHSVGELAAAAAAGVISWPEALAFALERGRAMHAAPPGAMLAIRGSSATVAAVVPNLRIAVQNGPEDLVAAGSQDQITEAARRLEAAGVPARLVAVPRAFHTPAMEQAAATVTEYARRLSMNDPRCAWISSRTGAPFEKAPLPEHWGAQILEPVQWREVIERLASEAGAVLELGPGSDLTKLGRRVHPALKWVAGGEDVAHAAASLHLAGLRLDWASWEEPYRRGQPPVPRIAWQRRVLWREASRVRPADTGLGARQEVAGIGVVFERALGAEQWMEEHRVGGTALVPAAFWLTWLTGVAGAARKEPTGLADLEVLAPTPWSSALSVQALVKDNREVLAYARHGEAPWQLVARGRVANVEAPRDPPPAVEGDALAPADAYATLAARGLDYGPVFQRAREVRLGAAGADGRLGGMSAPVGLPIHPALLDAALHPIALHGIHGGDAGGWLPVRAEKLAMVRPLEGESWCRARVREATAASRLVDVWIGDAGGVSLELRGLELRSLLRTRTRLAVPDWAPAPLTDGAVEPQVVVGPRAEEIAVSLRQVGVEARAVTEEELRSCSTAVLLVPSAQDVLAALRLCQSIGRGLADGGARTVTVVTRGAQATEAREAVSEAGAQIWGFVRSLRKELPELAWRLRDLPVGEGVDLLAKSLNSPEAELVLRSVPLVPGEKEVPLEAPRTFCQALRRPASGVLDETVLEAVPRPKAAAGEVVIAVRAAGLNFRDVLASLGLVPGPADFRLGGECCGRIEEVGKGVEGLAVGDLVAAFAPGSLATHVCADACEVVPLPAGLDLSEAATVPIAYATAWHALVERAALQAGERVLIHAAAGGVGLAAVHIARLLGAEVYATAHPSKWEALRELGVQKIASSRDLRFAEIFRAKGGVDVVLDALVGEAVDAGLGLLRPGGRFIEIGKRDVRDPQEVAAKWSVRYEAFDLAMLDAEGRGSLLRRVFSEVAARRLPPLPRAAFGLPRVREALKWMAEARHTGKVVLHVPPPQGGAVLITGGLGALGQLTARHLVERHGVTRVVLAGRDVREERLTPELVALRARGVELLLQPCDVTNAEQVAAAVERCGPSLTWVVHAAGVLDDAPALRQSISRMREVIAPKVTGAELLDAATRGRALAGFVVYGSAAAWLGPAGQAAYAAANAGLAAVVRRRRLRGEGGLLVAWGPWAGGGMASSSAVRRNLERLGIGLLQPDEALERLEDAWFNDLESVMVVSERRRESITVTAGVPSPVVAAPSDLPLPDRVRAIVARILGLEAAAVPEDRPLPELGLDSLAVVQLRNELTQTTGRQIQIASLDASVSLRTLTQLLSA